MSILSKLFNVSSSQAIACEDDSIITDEHCFPVDNLSLELKKRMYLEEESAKYGIKKEKSSTIV